MKYNKILETFGNFLLLSDFPAGILQSGFYTRGGPRYTNYATIGFIIAHEMTHGFDDMVR